MGPYTSDVRKAQYLTYYECRKTKKEAVKLYNLIESTAANIWKWSLAVKEERLTASLPPPEIKDLVSVKEKSGKPLILSVDDLVGSCFSAKVAVSNYFLPPPS
jgi:hypothetical protein